jgi:sporulation-control protein spo0M
MVTKGGSMTMTLSFNLPEEYSEAQDALQAGSALSVLDAFDQRMRSMVKYEAHPDEVVEAVDNLRTMLREICEEYHVRFDGA